MSGEDENLTRSATTGAEGGRQASGGERAVLAVGLRSQEPGQEEADRDRREQVLRGEAQDQCSSYLYIDHIKHSS